MNRPRAFPGRVIFDHFPKTGGLAVRDWLVENLGAGCVAHVVTARHRELIRQYGGEYSIICSHVAFPVNDTLDNRYQYVTCLRDPVDRALSWLYFAANTIPHDFIGDKLGANVRHLAQRAIDSEGQEFHEKLLRPIANFCTFHFSSLSHGSGSKVDRAFAAIQEFDIVGLYDDMPGFLADFADVLGIAAPAQIERKNVTKERPSSKTASPGLLERLRKENEDDIELYRRVREWKLSTAPRPQRQVIAGWVPAMPPERQHITPDFTLGTIALRDSPYRVRGDEIRFDVPFRLERTVAELNIRVNIVDGQGNLAFGIESKEMNQVHRNMEAGPYLLQAGIKADLPIGAYTASFEFTDRRPPGGGLPQTLGRHDGLCPFSVFQETPYRCDGYARLPVTLEVSSYASAGAAITDGQGSVTIPAPPRSIARLGETLLQVVISNRSAQAWAGDPFRPLSLSYHWTDAQGAPIVFDGRRSPLPQDCITPGETVEGTLKVVAPAEPGHYRLAPSLVQENVCWFENIGMALEAVEVEVV